MEYVAGGDMRGLMNNLISFPEEDAIFYLAEMILAVLDLHKLSYVHRDLKPGKRCAIKINSKQKTSLSLKKVISS